MSEAYWSLRTRLYANYDNSYESLPPNFSLGANMAAGAFAGIAVRLGANMHEAPIQPVNTSQEHSVMYPIDLLKVRPNVLRAWDTCASILI
jgi:solute carrier family 25 iron transporter 28/37